MDLSKVSTNDLIKELNSRDLLYEIGEDKKEWALDVRIKQIPFQFIDQYGDLYSLDYLLKTGLSKLENDIYHRRGVKNG